MSSHTTISVSKSFREQLREQIPKGVTYEAWLRMHLPEEFFDE